MKRWEQVFIKAKLTENEPSPCFIYEEKLSPYASIVAFKNLVPLSVWEKKREYLEIHINKDILNITQDEKDNQIIKLLIEDKPLTDCINWHDKYTDYSNEILNIGISSVGVVGIDLRKEPHAFVSSKTGHGKSNILKCMIHQAINKGYDVVLIDFKRGVSFSDFTEYIDVHFDYIPAIEALKAMVAETTRRLDLFRESRVDNLGDYNKVTGNNLERKIIFIDELTELLKPSDKALSKLIYDSLEALTRLSRAAGIHLIMGIHRPDSTIITGQIKNNVSFRICGHFADKEPSEIMLGNSAANKLPKDTKGRFIVKDDGMQIVQCFLYPKSAKDSLNRRIKKVSPTINKSAVLSSELNFDFSDIIK